MGTVANVQIRYSLNQQKPISDHILLYTLSDGYPHGVGGVINTIIRTRDYASRVSKSHSHGDQLDLIATALVKVSGGEFKLASREETEEYADSAELWDPDYKYEIILSPGTIHRRGEIVEITASRWFDSVDFVLAKRSLKHWERFNDITVAWNSIIKENVGPRVHNKVKDADPKVADSTYFEEVKVGMLNEIYRKLGPCPCDTCLAVGACLELPSSIPFAWYHRMSNKCKEKLVYEGKLRNYLLGLLSRDSELDKFFKKFIS